jgi:hypothetical protein
MYLIYYSVFLVLPYAILKERYKEARLKDWPTICHFIALWVLATVFLFNEAI